MATSLDNVTMFCQKCGTNGRADSYCTRCGEWMAAAGKLTRQVKSPEQMMKTILTMSGIGAIAALVNALVLYAGAFGWIDLKFAAFFAAAWLLALCSYQASSFYAGMKLKRRMTRGRADVSEAARADDSRRSTTTEWQTRSSVHAGTAPQLAPADVVATPPFGGSITEGTTELLPAPTPNRSTGEMSRERRI